MIKLKKYLILSAILCIGLTLCLFYFYWFPMLGNKSPGDIDKGLDEYFSEQFADYKREDSTTLSSEEKSIISTAVAYLTKRGEQPGALRASKKGIQYNVGKGKWEVSFRFDQGESDDRHVTIYVVEVDHNLVCSSEGFIEY